MRVIYYCCFTFLSVFISCTGKTKVDTQQEKVKVEEPKKDESKIGLPVIPSASFMKDFSSFWNYYSRNVELYEDFIAFDTAGKQISKSDFLVQLGTGSYVPVWINSKNDSINYKLEKIPAKTDKYVAAYMEQFAKEQLIFYKMQGKPLPKFSFTDINGKIYTPENTKGKIVLLKCWFITCQNCILEMPALNKLVEKYKDRKDILFISLAIDPKKALQKFLAKTKFDYATVPNQKDYMEKELHVVAYPTHFLINKAGILVRELPDDVQVAEALAKEVLK